MNVVSKNLDAIREEACNKILLTFTAFTAPTAAFSLLRGIERGWQWVMGVHIALVAVLLLTIAWRHRLSLGLRAAVLVGVPYTVAVSGLLAYGRGTGVVMFFITSCAVAGCFFNRRGAFAVVLLCVLALAGIYAGFQANLLDFPVNPSVYDMTPLSWLTFCSALIAAGAPPVMALETVVRSLEAERQRADDAVKVRADFLANMSHELRTPAASIIGMADVLKGTTLDSHQHEVLDHLLRSSHNLLGALNDVLDFSKFETGRIPLERSSFSLAQTIRDVCAVFEPAARRKNIALRIEAGSAGPDRLIGDAFRLSQVLSNLVDNALKFTEQGAVIVRYDVSGAAEGQSLLVCSVSDTGIGIAPERIDHVFDPFIQADMSITRKFGGSGLGLAICRRLVSAMDGEISAESSIGRGSVFTVRLPVEVDVAAREMPADTPPAISAQSDVPAASAALRLLVAEDDKYMRLLAEIMLPRLGHDIVLVEDGAAALKAAAAQTYDCIILDMHMPVMDGLEALRRLRQTEASGTALRRRTPIIALTADVLPQHTQSFLAAGADAVVTKPVNWEALQAKIVELTTPSG